LNEKFNYRVTFINFNDKITNNLINTVSHTYFITHQWRYFTAVDKRNNIRTKTFFALIIINSFEGLSPNISSEYKIPIFGLLMKNREEYNIGLPRNTSESLCRQMIILLLFLRFYVQSLRTSSVDCYSISINKNSSSFSSVLCSLSIMTSSLDGYSSHTGRYRKLAGLP
jgi:hypothetical protein